MSFTIDVRTGDFVATISLAGELDMATSPRLRQLIDRLIEDGRPRIVLDLGGLSFCDSAGLNTFVQGDKHCAARGGWLRLAHPRGHVARVLELSGVDEVLAYRPDDEPVGGARPEE
jgi:anti-anti-sigma factor